MPTAFRIRTVYGCLEEKFDIDFEGQAKQWAQRLLKNKKKVEIGFFHVDKGWKWVDYAIYLKNNKMRKYYSDFFL